MSVLVEAALYIMAILMWLFATPILFAVFGTANLSGIEGFMINLIPWAVLLTLVGRLWWTLKTSGGDS